MPPPATDQGTAPPAAPSSISHMAEHLPIAKARDLLDWLEGHGIVAEEVRVEDDGTMSVRWTAK